MRFFDKMRLRRKNRAQLNLYYPKNVYDPLARKEVKMFLAQFNAIYYEAYPEALTGPIHPIGRTRPRKHKRAFDINKQLTFYKTQKIRAKKLQKIEELLHLQYTLEAQVQHDNDLYERALYVQKRLQEGPYEDYFPQLFAERMRTLEHYRQQCREAAERMKKEHTTCVRAIEELAQDSNDFWSDTGRLVSSVVSQSVKQVVDTIDQTFKKK